MVQLFFLAVLYISNKLSNITTARSNKLSQKAQLWGYVDQYLHTHTVLVLVYIHTHTHTRMHTHTHAHWGYVNQYLHTHSLSFSVHSHSHTHACTHIHRLAIVYQLVTIVTFTYDLSLLISEFICGSIIIVYTHFLFSLYSSVK